MKTLRVIVICALTLAVVLAIVSPALLQGIVPDALINAARLDEFPLLSTCTRVASDLVSALRGGEKLSLDIVTNAVGDSFWEELLSLLMVAVLSIPVSLALGFLLYKPLYEGALRKGLLYASLNLCSVMIAWILYRQVYFALLIEGVIKENINDQTLQIAVSSLAQLASAAAIGAVALKLAVAFLATKVVVGKILLPIIGTVVRTLLFAFLLALMLLLQANPAQWTVIVPLMIATLAVSALSDSLFGS